MDGSSFSSSSFDSPSFGFVPLFKDVHISRAQPGSVQLRASLADFLDSSLDTLFYAIYVLGRLGCEQREWMDGLDRPSEQRAKNRLPCEDSAYIVGCCCYTYMYMYNCTYILKHGCCYPSDHSLLALVFVPLHAALQQYRACHIHCHCTAPAAVLVVAKVIETTKGDF